MSVDEMTPHPSFVAPAVASPRQGVVGLPFSVSIAATVLTFWTIDIIAPALPVIKTDLGLSAAGAGLVFSLLFFGRLLANIPAAYFVDRVGAATTGAMGGVLLAVGSLLGGIAESQATLLPARVIQGIGTSLLVSAALRSILQAKPGRGSAMSFFGFAATFGGLFGLFSGGYLTEAQGWRSVFALSFAIGVVLTLISGGTRLLSRAAAVITPAGTGKMTIRGQPEFKILIVACMLNFVVFVNYSIWVLVPLYTEERFDASAKDNAYLLQVITIMHLLAAFPSGRFVRSIGAERTLAAGLAITAAGTALVVFAPDTAWVALPMILYGAGQSAASTAAGDLILHLGGQGGGAVGMVRFSSDLGLVIGPFVGGAIADRLGYSAPFVLLPLLAATTAFVVLVRARTFEARREPI